MIHVPPLTVFVSLPSQVIGFRQWFRFITEIVWLTLCLMDYANTSSCATCSPGFWMLWMGTSNLLQYTIIRLFVHAFWVVYLNTATEFSQHSDLTVTSEERVLNAVLLWSLQAKECCGWEVIDECLRHSTPEVVFGERLESINHLLPFVRFPLMPSDLLKKVRMVLLSDLKFQVWEVIKV